MVSSLAILGLGLTCVRVAADMRDLAEDKGAFVVHTFHYRFPRFDLLLGPNSGHVRKSVGVCHDASAFCDEKSARCGTLCVVDCVVRLWNATERSCSCQWSQDNPASVASQIVNSLNLSETAGHPLKTSLF